MGPGPHRRRLAHPALLLLPVGIRVRPASARGHRPAPLPPIEDSTIAAVEFERAGVDILDITGGLSGYIRPGHDEPGYFAELSEAIKGAVSIPVILTGGVTEPQHAEKLLAEGKADLIRVGRAILKDSEWTVKAVRELGRPG